jgi:hypothetical protein
MMRMRTKGNAKSEAGYWKKKLQRLLKKGEVVKGTELKQKLGNKNERKKQILHSGLIL